jgi:hypothetical protein
LPTCRVRSTDRFNPARMTMPVRDTFENPCSSPVSVYSPGGRSMSRYSPCGPETAVRMPATVGLVAEMAAPGRRAPCTSWTTPRMLPSDAICAFAKGTLAISTINTRETARFTAPS